MNKYDVAGILKSYSEKVYAKKHRGGHMMKHDWMKPMFTEVPIDLSGLGDMRQLSDAELKIELENRGYSFKKKFQIKSSYLQREIDFLCNEMKEPRTTNELEEALENEFHIPHKQAVEDVLDFLKDLREKDMVIVS